MQQKNERTEQLVKHLVDDVVMASRENALSHLRSTAEPDNSSSRKARLLGKSLTYLTSHILFPRGFALLSCMGRIAASNALQGERGHVGRMYSEDLSTV